MFTSLRNLHAGEFCDGRRHPVIRTVGNAREIPRITTELKLVTGTHILQCNRSAFNQNEIEPTCLLCKTDIETTEHFLLCFPALHSARQSILDIINGLYSSLHDPQRANHPKDLLQIVLDCTCSVLYLTSPKRNHHIIETIETLIYSLHCEHYKRLALVPNESERHHENMSM